MPEHAWTHGRSCHASPNGHLQSEPHAMGRERAPIRKRKETAMRSSNVVSEAMPYRGDPTPKAAQRPRVAAILPMFTSAFYFEACSALFRTLAKRGVDLVLIDAASDVDADLHLARL